MTRSLRRNILFRRLLFLRFPLSYLLFPPGLQQSSFGTRLAAELTIVDTHAIVGANNEITPRKVGVVLAFGRRLLSLLHRDLDAFGNALMHICGPARIDATVDDSQPFNGQRAVGVDTEAVRLWQGRVILVPFDNWRWKSDHCASESQGVTCLKICL